MKTGSLNLLEPPRPVQELLYISFTSILSNQLLENDPLFEKFTGPNTLKIDVSPLFETMAR